MNHRHLSHSSTQLFSRCPRAYSFHYIQRIRPKIISANLLFGSAVDRASTVIFKKEGDKTPLQVFDYAWRFQEINGKQVYLPKCTSIAYTDSDFDIDLFNQEDLLKFKEEHKIEDVKDTISKIIAWKKDNGGLAALPTKQLALLNEACWYCLKNKGRLFLTAIEEQLLPKIEQVISVQEKVEISNGEDSIIGFVDLVARLKGYPDPIILDLKTSRINYSEDSNELSPQLSLYVHALSEKYSSNYGGFFVLNKNIVKNKKKICKLCGTDSSGGHHKTCPNEVSSSKTNKKGEVVGCVVRCGGDFEITMNPKVLTQCIISEVPERMQQIVVENFDYINESIKTNSFPRAFSGCIQKFGKCEYYDYCHFGSKEGLIKLEERKSE